MLCQDGHHWWRTPPRSPHIHLGACPRPCHGRSEFKALGQDGPGHERSDNGPGSDADGQDARRKGREGEAFWRKLTVE